MTRLSNSIKQIIKKCYRVYVFILFIFNAFRTACVCCFNPLERFVIETNFRLTFSLRFKF